MSSKSKSIKTVVIVNYQFNVIGGIEVSCMAINSLLRKMWLDVHFIEFLKTDWDSCVFDGSPLHSLGEKVERNPLMTILKPFIRAYEIRRIATTVGADFVISNGEICNFSNVLSKKLFWGKYSTGLIVHNSPDYYKWKPLWTVFIWLIKKLYPLADAVISVAKELEAELRNSYGIPQSICRTIYNPIEHSDKREPFESGGTRNSFVHVGRLDEVKNQAFIMRAFDVFWQKHGGSLTIFWEGPARSHLEKLKRELASCDYIRIAGEARNVRSLLSEFDFFLFASLNEWFGRSPVEALICGIPVISHDYRFWAKEILRWDDWTNSPCQKIEITKFWVLTPYMDFDDFVRWMELAAKTKFNREDIKKNSFQRFWMEKAEIEWRKLLWAPL